MNYRINHVFEIFENWFEIENLKFEILEIENFEMNLKFGNFELRLLEIGF